MDLEEDEFTIPISVSLFPILRRFALLISSIFSLKFNVPSYSSLPRIMPWGSTIPAPSRRSMSDLPRFTQEFAHACQNRKTVEFYGQFDGTY
jgi:hypothetical protein